MKPVLFLLLFVLGISRNYSQSSLAGTGEGNYEIECIGVGKQGEKIVKIWTYSNTPDLDLSRALKNAIHGITFKGYDGNDKGCASFQALIGEASSASEKQKEFLNRFLTEGGGYKDYVSPVANGNISPGDRLKLGKGKYKLGLIVTVKVDALRNYYRNNGLIETGY